MALTQQTGWLCGAMPLLAPLWEQTDKHSGNWGNCIVLAENVKEAGIGDIFPFETIPAGPGGKRIANEHSSRTAALRFSRKLAESLTDKACTEKGHTGAWLCTKLNKNVQAGLRRLCPLLPADADLSRIYLSVLPILDSAEAYTAILAPAKPEPKPRAARKPKGKKEAAEPAATEAAPEPAQEAEANGAN